MNAPRFFGRKKPTRADHAVALASLIAMRTKAYSEREIEGIARSHRTTVEAVKAKLRETGRGHLIEADAWLEGGADA